MKYFIALLMSMMVVSGEVWARTEGGIIATNIVSAPSCIATMGNICFRREFFEGAVGFGAVGFIFSATLALYGFYLGKVKPNQKLDKHFITTTFVKVIYIFGFGTLLLYIGFSFYEYRVLFFPLYLYCIFMPVAGLIYLILIKLHRVKWKKRWLAANILAVLFLSTWLILFSVSQSDWASVISYSLPVIASQVGLGCGFILINTLPYEIFKYYKRKSSKV